MGDLVTSSETGRDCRIASFAVRAKTPQQKFWHSANSTSPKGLLKRERFGFFRVSALER